MIKTEMMKKYEQETGNKSEKYIMVHVSVDGYDHGELVHTGEYVAWLEAKIESHLTWHDELPKDDGRYICSIGEDKYPVICAKKCENGRWLLGEREKIRWAYLPTSQGGAK